MLGVKHLTKKVQHFETIISSTFGTKSSKEFFLFDTKLFGTAGKGRKLIVG